MFRLCDSAYGGKAEIVIKKCHYVKFTLMINCKYHFVFDFVVSKVAFTIFTYIAGSLCTGGQ